MLPSTAAAAALVRGVGIGVFVCQGGIDESGAGVTGAAIGAAMGLSEPEPEWEPEQPLHYKQANAASKSIALTLVFLRSRGCVLVGSIAL
jgi:hypothetical protein